MIILNLISYFILLKVVCAAGVCKSTEKPVARNSIRLGREHNGRPVKVTVRVVNIPKSAVEYEIKSTMSSVSRSEKLLVDVDLRRGCTEFVKNRDPKSTTSYEERPQPVTPASLPRSLPDCLSYQDQVCLYFSTAAIYIVALILCLLIITVLSIRIYCYEHKETPKRCELVREEVTDGYEPPPNVPSSTEKLAPNENIKSHSPINPPRNEPMTVTKQLRRSFKQHSSMTMSRALSKPPILRLQKAIESPKMQHLRNIKPRPPIPGYFKETSRGNETHQTSPSASPKAARTPTRPHVVKPNVRLNHTNISSELNNLIQKKLPHELSNNKPQPEHLRSRQTPFKGHSKTSRQEDLCQRPELATNGNISSDEEWTYEPIRKILLK
ncbi:uncharacterized protein LOC101741928 isoform X2 [Bombyx mori]|uniref:uncharacterized protein LOC101741928 isoform X2 n=1 Tax=Bombyx mori TaxID=7091 RepID=UPI002ED45105